ncbi:MAG: hypothetical protein VXZ82_23115 [Planctomycetota bacterium]|nr:hypothetical protein [Planctomycetota bacterium]
MDQSRASFLPGDSLLWSCPAKAVKSGRRLELGEEPPSERCIPDLFRLVESRLCLGDGSFSEAAIIAHAGELHVLQNSLRLHGKQYTSRALAAIESSAKLDTLDMSHSGVNTETRRVIESLYTEILDLSHTQIDDGAIPKLSQVKVSTLNLSDTAMTAEGISRDDWSLEGRLLV